MTQVSQYGQHAEGHRQRHAHEGQRALPRRGIANDTIEAAMLGADTVLEIDSPDPPDRVAKVVRNVQRGLHPAGAAKAGAGHRPDRAETERRSRRMVKSLAAEW
jgi:hypothetical protein